MHAFQDVTVKSTYDLERGYFYLSFRLQTLDKVDLEILANIKQELINRGVIPMEGK